MSSKRYPEEFKIEAVRQVTDRGHSVAQVAERLLVSGAEIRLSGCVAGLQAGGLCPWKREKNIFLSMG